MTVKGISEELCTCEEGGGYFLEGIDEFQVTLGLHNLSLVLLHQELCFLLVVLR